MSATLRAMDADTVRADDIIASVREDTGADFAEVEQALHDVANALLSLPGAEMVKLLEDLEGLGES